MWVRNKIKRRIQNGTEFLKPWAARTNVRYFSQLIRDKGFGLFNDTSFAYSQRDYKLAVNGKFVGFWDESAQPAEICSWFYL